MIRSIILVTALLGCQKKSTFDLSAADDNNETQLAAAIEAAKSTSATTPTLYIAREGSVSAFDLNSQQVKWNYFGKVESRLAATASQVGFVQGNTLIALSDKTGEQAWRKDIRNIKWLSATDAEIIVSSEDTEGARIQAFSESGKIVWTHTAKKGEIGTPVSAGNAVFVPYLKQWISILDSHNGTPIARLRRKDAQVEFLKHDGEHGFFGAGRKVVAIDAKAASGVTAESNFVELTVPKAFSNHATHTPLYGATTNYGASDRKKLLWAGNSDVFSAINYRYLFSFDGGKTSWAKRFDTDIVSATSLEDGLMLLVTDDGAIFAADKAGKLETIAQVEKEVVGALCRCNGFSPAVNAPVDHAAELTKIASDRDSRFDEIKTFAIAELGKREGVVVTQSLIDIAKAERSSDSVRDAAVRALSARRDPQSTPLYVSMLDSNYDYLSDTQPQGVGGIALALAGIPEKEIAADTQKSAVVALRRHLHASELPDDDRIAVILALANLHAAGGLGVLTEYVTMYRVSGAKNMEEVLAEIVKSGAYGREFATYVRDDEGAVKSVRDAAVKALAPKKIAN